jgi:hypothetical protein
VSAIAAQECPHVINHFEISTFNINRLPVDQGICNHPSGLLDNSSESRPRNIHVLPCVCMGHTDEIGKPYCFAFIHRKANLGKIPHGNTPGLEIVDIRIERHHAMFFGSRHKYLQVERFRVLIIFPSPHDFTGVSEHHPCDS